MRCPPFHTRDKIKFTAFDEFSLLQSISEFPADCEIVFCNNFPCIYLVASSRFVRGEAGTEYRVYRNINVLFH